MKDFDAFISHASEDKRYFVKPLSQKLQEYGAKIWYDEFSLKPGMSLSRTIEHGLGKSKFGLVVLSESFFKKKWTEYELKALNALELSNPGTIIPIWYKVDLEKVREFSPYLSDKLAIVFDKKSIDDIAIEVLEVIREDLFEGVLRKRAFNEMLKNAKTSVLTKEEFGKLKVGPIRHEKLSIELIIRIRLIRSILIDVHPHSFEYWLEGFQRDTHPEDEIHIWEKIATTYKESLFALGKIERHKMFDVFRLVFAIFNGIKVENVTTKFLSVKERNIIYNISRCPIPYYDIKDKKFADRK